MNIDWVSSQLKGAKVKKSVGNTVIKMLQAFEQIDEKDEFKAEAVSIFSKLALGHTIIPESGEEQWIPVRPGSIKVADEVRVRSDAFNGELGVAHNGRRGIVVGVRYGDVVINSTDDKTPHLKGAHYPPDKLEKLVKK